MLLPHLAGATLDVAMREAEGEHGPFEELFHDCKAHYLPLLSCLRYLLARDERGHRGLNQAQVWQVALAMQRVEIAVLPCKTALHLPAWCRPRLRPLLRTPERLMSVLEACCGTARFRPPQG